MALRKFFLTTTFLALRASAAASAKQLFHVHLAPGNYDDLATTVDAAGAPSFLFSSGYVPPFAAKSYDASGHLRWTFVNESVGGNTKVFEVTAARHCESGGKGAGAVDVFVTESDLFNQHGLTVFGLSSGAASAKPAWTLPLPECNSEDGGYTVKASDRGGRIVVQANCANYIGATVFGVNGQTGAVEWRYTTKNTLSGTDTGVSISASGDWVLFADAWSPDTTNNATVLSGATGEVRDTTSIPLPYFSQSSAISDSGNYVAVVDEIAVNVYKWRASRNKYELAYVLAPPPGTVAVDVNSVAMSTGRDKDEMLVAQYDTYGPDGKPGVAAGIWSLTTAQLQTTWARADNGASGGLSADGDFVALAAESGVVLLRRGSNEEIFSFRLDTTFKTSINVVPASGGGGGSTVFLAVAGGNNGGGGKGNTGDAYAFEIDVPAAAVDRATSAAAAAEEAAAAPVAPCFGTFNGDTPLEELCFSTLLNSSTAPGLSVRQYSAAVAAAARLVSYNVSQLYPATTYSEALTLGGFGVIEYFLGGFNAKHENLLDARTVPFLVLPPGPAGGWVARMAVAPSKFPNGAKLPAPLSNVTIAELGAAKGAALTLAVLQSKTRGTKAPTGEQLAALCATAGTEIAAGALPGYSVDAASPFAGGVFALYFGRDLPQGTAFVAECWLGVAASAK